MIAKLFVGFTLDLFVYDLAVNAPAESFPFDCHTVLKSDAVLNKMGIHIWSVDREGFKSLEGLVQS